MSFFQIIMIRQFSASFLASYLVGKVGGFDEFDL